ncbi:MAG TPA: NYN domain-containing protein, partial [Candidatus Faecousia faecipullorum]|nr:NYN domain-containing protein [Candidatus Faecousia faecipullorum]
YNIIFAWEELKNLAREDLDAARRRLCDLLSSFAGFTKCRLVLVFDGYKQKGSPGEKSRYHNIQVVYTREGETADAYIEALADEIGGNYAVRVASSDGLVQLSSFRSGVLRMTARELKEEVDLARKEMEGHYHK